ncbi:Dbl homology domain-containing protein [Choanephora cucurbitarum]|nr:Dbl homology domain-containing protein [Choanephora cucurbitarum]
MPPHFLVDEGTTFEAKQWASSTIDSLFSNTQPVTFEPVQTTVQEIKTAQRVEALKSSYVNPARRSLSMLEVGLFSRNKNNSNNNSDDGTINSRPIARSVRSHTGCFLSHSGSAPSLLLMQNQQPQQKSLASRLKRTLSVEKPHMSQSPLNSKEREGIDVWKSTFRDYLQDTKMSPHGQSPHLLNFVLNELITTETTYLEHLLIIKHMFMDPLMEAATAQPRPLVNLKDIQTIFAFIPDLIALSSALVGRLKEATCTTEHGEVYYDSIGQIFYDLEEEFTVYIRYAANVSKQKKCIQRADRSIVYRQLVQDSLRKKETNRMGLSDYTIAPIQRITRYGLLLKDLVKCSDPSSLDFDYITRSLKCQLALAHAMNAVQNSS